MMPSITSFEAYRSATTAPLSKLSLHARIALVTACAYRGSQRCRSALAVELRPEETAILAEVNRVLCASALGASDPLPDLISLRQRLQSVRGDDDDQRAVETHPLLTDYLVMLDAGLGLLLGDPAPSAQEALQQAVEGIDWALTDQDMYSKHNVFRFPTMSREVAWQLESLQALLTTDPAAWYQIQLSSADTLQDLSRDDTA